ncbi:MAG: GNAT family N-acetyltransferase [Methylophilaceae bacterium]
MLNFHKADLVDAESVAKLINDSYRGETSRKGWTTEADILDGLRTTTANVAKIINRSDAFMLIGVLNDEIVAAICCELQVIAFKHTTHFGLIAVKPSLQNKGYGKDLITAAETMTKREWRVAGFHMTVISLRSELIAFYERLGYMRTGELKEFPKNSDLWQPKVEGLSLEYLAKLA